MLNSSHGMPMISHKNVMSLLFFGFLLMNIGNFDLVNIVSHGHFFSSFLLFGESGLLRSLNVHLLKTIFVFITFLVLCFSGSPKLHHLLTNRLSIFLSFIILATPLHFKLLVEHVSDPSLLYGFVFFFGFHF